MVLTYTETLKIIDPITLEESEITQCRIDNKVIYSKDINAKVKFGCNLIRTHADGFIEEYRVQGVAKKLWTLVIQI